MTTLAFFVVAAFFEIAGCFAFWSYFRLGRSAWALAAGMMSLALVAYALTRVDTAFAGRAYAAYGGRPTSPWARVASRCGRRSPRSLGSCGGGRVHRQRVDSSCWDAADSYAVTRRGMPAAIAAPTAMPTAAPTALPTPRARQPIVAMSPPTTAAAPHRRHRVMPSCSRPRPRIPPAARPAPPHKASATLGGHAGASRCRVAMICARWQCDRRGSDRKMEDRSQERILERLIKRSTTDLPFPSGVW